MGGIWTVARETFTQCVRTKVAAVFAVLLVASLALLPSLMEGDGTLAGRIRTFLDYSAAAVSVLGSLVVVFLSVGVVSGDVRDKHVFLVCTKPLSRWQYIVGRWLGVVLLGGVLLGGASAGVYGLAQYLRGRTDLAVRPEDSRAVETEIFAARAKVAAEPPDVEAAVAERIGQKKRDGTWQALMDAYRANYELTEADAASKLVDDLRKDAVAEAQSAGPPWQADKGPESGDARAMSLRAGRELSWKFANVHVAERARSARGRVRGVAWHAGLIVTVETTPEITGRLTVAGPVWVNDLGGRVVATWKNGFRVLLRLEKVRAEQLRGLRRGSEVEVVVEPTLHVSYKVSPASRAPDKPLRVAWNVANPTTGYVYHVPPQDTPVDQRATFLAPARAVDEKGNVRISLVNHSPTTVTVLNDDMSVLYRVGGFEANFLKTVGLIFVGLMFLAALGVFAGSALSFPVGCVLCFVMLWIATTLRFLSESISLGLQFPRDGEPSLL